VSPTDETDPRLTIVQLVEDNQLTTSDVLGYYQALERWSLGWELVSQPWAFSSLQRLGEVDLGRLVQNVGGSSVLRDIEFNIPSKYGELALASASDAATSALQSIQTFLLPFLYGLLGASVYILRSLSTDIKALTFESSFDYVLRLPLGALSGVAVAWIINFPSQQQVASLSPLALAFLAGYSVEVLFSALDRVVKAFSTESAR
jgi:hypothetical protein